MVVVMVSPKGSKEGDLLFLGRGEGVGVMDDRRVCGMTVFIFYFSAFIHLFLILGVLCCRVFFRVYIEEVYS